MTHTYTNFSKRISLLLRSSRFPYFWIWVGGYILFGWMYARHISGISTIDTEFVLVFIWCVTFGNIYLNNINDAFDYETDVLNPRKSESGTIEQCVDTNSSKKVYLRSMLALSSGILLIPFIHTYTTIMLCIWSLSIYMYNVPFFRFKKIPFLETFFASMHFIPLFIIGYLSLLHEFPDVKVVLWFFLYTWTWIFLANSLDVPYDKVAGIKNITVRIGSTKLSLYVTFLIATIQILFSYSIGFTVISIISLCTPIFLIYLLKTKLYETNHPKTYSQYIYISYIIGFSIGLCFYFGLL